MMLLVTDLISQSDKPGKYCTRITPSQFVSCHKRPYKKLQCF